MEFHTSFIDLVAQLAVWWLPVFAVASILQWLLLTGRRWRIRWMAACFCLQACLALVILFSPFFRIFLRPSDLFNLLEFGGTPLLSALLSAAITTLLLFALVRRGMPPGSSFKPKPLRGSA